VSKEKIIMFDSPEAASIQQVTGWVSRNGLFCGPGESGERAARYDGCTHRKCEVCGAVVGKHHLLCKECSDKKDDERYHAMPKKKWDGRGMIYTDHLDTYFSDMEEAEEFSEDEGIPLAGLHLIICEPQYPPLLGEDHFCDVLPEDGDTPDELLEAIHAFNETIKMCPPCSYSPGKYAVDLSVSREAQQDEEAKP